MKAVFTILALYLFVTSIEAQARTLKATEALRFVPGISKSCQQVCGTPLVFASPGGGQNPAYSCRINLENGEVAPGYQAGTNTCHAAYYNEAVESTNYDCGCLADGAVPGLNGPSGNACTNSCQKSIDGSPGQSLVDGVGHVCLALSEMGVTNHFGFTESGKCNFVPGGSQANGPLSTDDYSCVCSFTVKAVGTQVASINNQAEG